MIKEEGEMDKAEHIKELRFLYNKAVKEGFIAEARMILDELKILSGR